MPPIDDIQMEVPKRHKLVGEDDATEEGIKKKDLRNRPRPKPVIAAKAVPSRVEKQAGLKDLGTEEIDVGKRIQREPPQACGSRVAKAVSNIAMSHFMQHHRC
jgi:hypothetical protein